MNSKSTLFLFCLLPSTAAFAEPEGDIHRGEDMVITTSHKLFPNTTIATPSFDIGEKEIEKINVSTAEDIVKFAPGIQIRRRFIGDTNGVVATRGSTNFQTAHTMLFQDGIPLSNLTQTKWDGAPRWGQIAPNSVESVKIFYGPFSAQHAGNSFGSVIEVKTKMPEKFEMHFDAMGMMQAVDRLGRDDTLWGHKEFISAGNRFGDFTVSGFFNHIENQGQPQMWDAQTDTSRAAQLASAKPSELVKINAAWDSPTAVTGGRHTKNTAGQDVIITGDSGIEETVNDLYSLKFGYDLTDNLRALFNINFEDFERKTGQDDLAGRNYLQQADGSTYWGTGSSVATQDGMSFLPTKRSYGSSRYAPSESIRQTLSYGLNLSGQVTDTWSIDTSASYFDAFKDYSFKPDFSSLDPNNNGEGDITEKEMWWATFDFKLATHRLFGNKDLGFMWGYQYHQADLNKTTYNSDDIAKKERSSLKQDAGGETQLHSGFAQMDYDFLDDWNIMAGARLDVWSASGGHDIKEGFGAYNRTFADREQTRISPKASLAWSPNEFSARYSFSRAYRFALAQELYESSSTGLTKSIPDPTLGPESGNFHNLTLAYEIPDGLVSVDFFYNEIENEIMNTKQLINNVDVSTFLGIDKTETIGVQMVYKQDNIFGLPLDINLNGTWLDKQIKENAGNPNLVGKQWVRTSNWKANGSATYHITNQFQTTLSANYRGPQFAREDNSDNTSGVYGASDEYLLLNIKSQYKQPIGNDMIMTISAGVDNLLDEDYYDHHPYPQRSYFASIALDI
jgi:iron complex outermembrane receptor protein